VRQRAEGKEDAMMHRRAWLAGAIGAAIGCAVLLLAPSAEAMRYVEFNILQGQRIVLRTSVGDSGHEDAATVWRYLRRLPLRSMNGYAVRPNPGQPLRATLTGKLRIQGNWGEEVTLSRLRLVRADASAKWTIDPQDVAQTLTRRRPARSLVK
jgi:hypothetical protein